ncbi:MAG: hypothetical protein AAGA10_16565 [Bacteroidota bacterium]
MKIPPEIDHSKQWKYAQIEVERRFLLDVPPNYLDQLPFKHITDLYIHATRLRLRKVVQKTQTQYKLTKKLLLEPENMGRQWISTLYLSEQEYLLFATLPGFELKKKRYRYESANDVQIGIDEIQIHQAHLWIAEIEFSDGQKTLDKLPFTWSREITQEPSFSGFELAKQYAERLSK